MKRLPGSRLMNNCQMFSTSRFHSKICEVSLRHFQLSLTGSTRQGKEETVPVNGIPAGLDIKSFQETRNALFTSQTSHAE